MVGQEEVEFDPNKEERIKLYERMIKLLNKIDELEETVKAQKKQIKDLKEKIKNPFGDFDKFKDLFPDPSPLPDYEKLPPLPKEPNYWTYKTNWNNDQITYKYFSNYFTLPS
jgi:hypothetical protein